MHLLRRLRGLVFVAVGAALICPGSARAQEGADFYKGKTVSIIVGLAPGGGYDAYARMLAPHLEKVLGATVIVDNQPGGAGLNALNALVRSKPDGLSMMLLNGEGAALAKLVDRPGLRFDLRTIQFLGRTSYERRVLLAKADTPFATVPGFAKAQDVVRFGAGGRIDGMGDAASIFCRAMEIKCKLITGYGSATEVTLAVMRGEVDAQVMAESQAASLIKDGKIAAVAILGPNEAPLLPGVPSIFNVYKLTEKQGRWIRFRSDIADIGRTFVVPPDVPADRVNVLREAVKKVLTDPAVLAEGEKTGRPISYEPPEATRKVIEETFTKISAAEAQDFKKLILEDY